MAQASVSVSGEHRMIYKSKVDITKAIILTFIAFLFTGYQAAIYGMLTVPVSGHFHIHANMIVFYDGFGLWGQILAMACGGFIIATIKGKNTLLLAGILMIVGSLVAIVSPNIYIYTAMSFLCNIAVGLVLVSCYYMIMGTVEESGKSEGLLSILNVFFAGGYMISPILNGFIIKHLSWKAVFIIIAVLFVVFIAVLLALHVNELLDKHSRKKVETKTELKAQGKNFITFPLILTAIAFFFFVYAEQIIYYFNQPYLMLNLKFSIEVAGAALTTFALAQMTGRFLLGTFLLSKIKIYKYIIISVIIYAVLMVIYLNLNTVVAVFIVMACIGLADSSVYPSILGYGLDQIGHASPAATSFMVTIGSIGIPLGTGACGLIGEKVGRVFAISVGPVLLIAIAIIIFIVHMINVSRKSKKTAA